MSIRVLQARSPVSESSDKSVVSGMLEQDRASSRMGDDAQDDEERENLETENEAEMEERMSNAGAVGLAVAAAAAAARPFDNMPEYVESTMQELFATYYGLAGGELAKSVSRQLQPASFLNPAAGNQMHQQGKSTPSKLRPTL